MVDSLPATSNDRKWRLFVVACGRHVILPLLPEAQIQRALEVIEAFADGAVGSADLEPTLENASIVANRAMDNARIAMEEAAQTIHSCESSLMFPDVYAFGEDAQCRTGLAAARGAEWEADRQSAAASAVQKLVQEIRVDVKASAQASELARTADWWAKYVADPATALECESAANKYRVSEEEPGWGPPQSILDLKWQATEHAKAARNAAQAACNTAIQVCNELIIATSDETNTALLRDIFGKTCSQVTVDPSWLSSTVLAVAKSIYVERAFCRMPILGDALQDAGCADPELLEHCRGPGPHFRGCWVIDLLLGPK